MEKTPDKRACRYVETPIGPITLVACGEALVEARFGGFPISPMKVRCWTLPSGN